MASWAFIGIIKRIFHRIATSLSLHFSHCENGVSSLCHVAVGHVASLSVPGADSQQETGVNDGHEHAVQQAQKELRHLTTPDSPPAADVVPARSRLAVPPIPISRCHVARQRQRGERDDERRPEEEAR